MKSVSILKSVCTAYVIIEKKDFEAFLARSRVVNLIYYIVGVVSTLIIWNLCPMK